MKTARFLMILALLLATGLAAGIFVFKKRRPADSSITQQAAPPVPAPTSGPVPPPLTAGPTPAAAVNRLQRAARIIRVADAIPASPGTRHVPTKADELLPDAPPPLPLPPDFLEKMVDQTGKIASFTLPGGTVAVGSVELIQHDVQGNISLVQGRLSAPSPGFFYFVKEAASGVAGAFSGNARLDNVSTAYRAEPIGPGGAPMLVPRRVDQVMCLGMPAVKIARGGAIENAPQTYPTNAPAPVYNNNVVSLQSLPGAKGVIYLDFNGGPGPWIGWGNFVALPSGANNAQIRDVWQRVAEDYQGFNLNITTDILVFNAAPANSRQHVMITPTTNAAPGAGGVAYENSFNTSADEVNWAFYTTGKTAAEVVSHEVGHTVGLSHMGQNLPDGTHNEYYTGQGSGDVGWAPIMGAGYYDNLTQFSKGDYANPSNTEDQLAIIASNNNNLAYRADDDGATFATAKYLEILDDNTVSNEGILETTGDVDAYRFTVTASSSVSITVNPVNASPNLDILASIYKSDDSTLVASANPATTLPATVAATLAPGDYTLKVTGTGYGNPLTTGYSNYGVIGAYLISGTVPNGVKPERFSVAENVANATAVGTASPRNAHGSNPLTYSISSGNTAGAFAINPSTGAITVADRTKLNYEALSTRWDVPAVIPMFVTVTDATNPALNETIRVVVTVTNVNEAPTITGGGSLTMIARTSVGTNLLQVTGSDPDQLDYVTYSIAAGNTGGAFAVDAFGVISPAISLDVTTQTVYTLTVRASDQGTPALTADTTVTITVVPLAAGYTPGTIADAFYNNVAGNAVSNLTGSANFPYNASSEVSLPSADEEADQGSNYGSAMRGFVIPPATGSYTFWIASDDSGELRISTDATQANAVVRASNASYTNPNTYNTFASQQSTALALTAGQPYYIEARQKQGNGGNHLSVAWQGPGFSQQVIPGRFLAPFHENYVPSIPAATLSMRRDAYVGSAIGLVPVTDLNAADGHNAFTITGGTGAGLFSVDAATGIVRANASPSSLATGSSYTLNISTSDTGTPVLSGGGTVAVNVIDPTTINVAGILQQIWTNMPGFNVANLTSDARYPYAPTTTRTLTTFEGPAGYGSNYGTRIRALLTPPTTGSYTFYISSDDSSSLLFNAGGSASGAAQIASVSGYTNPGVYTTQVSQTSAAFALTGGQPCYIEALQKQGNGGDFLQVAWTGPGIASPTIIPGSALNPYNLNAAPVFNSVSYAFSLRPNSSNGTPVGTVAATDPEGGTLTYAILAGNSSGAFAINPATGAITLANGAPAAPGQTFALAIGAQDDGLGGAYPLGAVAVPVAVTIPKPIDQWRQDNFGANAGNAAIAGNLVDPDGDGLSNLLEYALGTNPLLSNAGALVVDQETIGANTYLRLTVTKNPAATDVTYTPEATGDLTTANSWSGANLVVETNTATTLRVRDNVAASAAAQRFIRLRVTVP